MGCELFPEGYPTQIQDKNGKAREITKCSGCNMPRLIPDDSRPGQLKKCEAHQPDCPRALGTYTHKTGKKAGRVAANHNYKK